MPGSAILPFPTTRSWYWSPLASLCTLPPAAPAAGAEPDAGASVGVVTLAPVAVVVVVALVVVVAFSVWALPDVVAAGAEPPDVDCPEVTPDCCEVWLQPERLAMKASARAAPSATDGLDMRDSFRIGRDGEKRSQPRISH